METVTVMEKNVPVYVLIEIERRVKIKMIEKKIKNFTNTELKRVFKDDVLPLSCIKIAKQLILNGLTIEEVRKNICDEKLLTPIAILLDNIVSEEELF